MAKERDTEAERIAALERELSSLRKVVARVDPETILKTVPDLLTVYNPALPGKVLALAAVGQFTSEIRSELGISPHYWQQWATEHPQFAAAKARGLDLAKAHWHKIARKAIEDKDWKLPYSNLMRMISELSAEDEAENRGDASRLVIYEPGKAA